MPPGLAANPQAPPPKCSITTFDEADGLPRATASVGTIEMEAVAEPLGLLPVSLPSLTGTVYNLDGTAPTFRSTSASRSNPRSADRRRSACSSKATSTGASDYHEYFEINNVPNEAEVKALLGVNSPLKVLKSKLNFNGRAGGQLPDAPERVLDHHDVAPRSRILEQEKSRGPIRTRPSASKAATRSRSRRPSTVTPETSQSDSPDGASTVVQVPQKAHEDEINTSDIRDAHVTLPEGLTLNPVGGARAAGVLGRADRHRHDQPGGVPGRSQIGTVLIETDLPPGSLAGNVYLGSPSGAPISGPPYTIYLDAESALRRLGPARRARSSPNPQTGRSKSASSKTRRSRSANCADAEGRRARAARQPARLRQHQTQAPVHPLHGASPRLELDALRDHAAARAAALLARAEHRERLAHGGRLHGLHVQPRREPTGSSTCRTSERCCRRASSA